MLLELMFHFTRSISKISFQFFLFQKESCFHHLDNGFRHTPFTSAIFSVYIITHVPGSFSVRYLDYSLSFNPVLPQTTIELIFYAYESLCLQKWQGGGQKGRFSLQSHKRACEGKV